MIYFLREDGGGEVKIGWTKASDADPRRLQLQTGNPRPLVLMGTIPGTLAQEGEIHKQFAEYRIRNEWFQAAPELLAAIRMMMLMQGEPMPLKQELDRRSGCRYGLRGVTVALRGQGADLHVIESTRWDRDRRLVLATYPADGPPALDGRTQLQQRHDSGEQFPPEVFIHKGRVLGARADYFPRTIWPMGSFHDVPIEDALLMSDWPIVCNCWTEEST